MTLEVKTTKSAHQKRRKKKKKKRGKAPRCRACRKIQNEDEVTVTFEGLYVPYEQNFVPETMFYFCPKQQCTSFLLANKNILS